MISNNYFKYFGGAKKGLKYKFKYFPTKEIFFPHNNQFPQQK